MYIAFNPCDIFFISNKSCTNHLRSIWLSLASYVRKYSVLVNNAFFAFFFYPPSPYTTKYAAQRLRKPNIKSADLRNDYKKNYLWSTLLHIAPQYRQQFSSQPGYALNGFDGNQFIRYIFLIHMLDWPILFWPVSRILPVHLIIFDPFSGP